MKKLIDVTLYDEMQHNRDWPPEPAAETVAWFAAKVDSIPGEFRSTAKISIEEASNYGESCARIVISYQRPETDEEELRRKQAAALKAGCRRERELRMLAALQAKYSK